MLNTNTNVAIYSSNKIVFLRANEVLKQRDARKQEKIREELEHIKLYMAGEAGFDSEDECHQVEIVPNDAPLQHIALVQTESTDGELSDISVSYCVFVLGSYQDDHLRACVCVCVCH